MSANNAGKILRRLVPASELNGEKNLQKFWLVAPFVVATSTLVASKSTAAAPVDDEDEEEEDDDDEAETEEGRSEVQSVEGLQLALKYSGNLEWGVRRKVRYVARPQREYSESLPPLSAKREVEEEEEEVAGAMEVVQNVICTRKRSREQGKLQATKNKKKEVKTKDQKSIMKSRKKKKGRYSENTVAETRSTRQAEKESRGRWRSSSSKDRWSTERYKAAELKLLDIMRERNAVLGDPILRQELREEARKHIGDTGLLDHLLKHMAGKCVNNQTERFRRRHNAEGAMEYWLEPAELDEVRRNAGVMDPYWLPPAGWKPGDSTSTSCTCTGESQKEISLLREEMGLLKRLINY